MKKSFLLLAIFYILFSFTLEAQRYKEMMGDPSINFYEVVSAAETYFKDIDIHKKGSGYKNYMRWKSANEFKYYPSGDRSNVEPYFVEKAYKKFLTSNDSSKSHDFSKMNGVWQELGPVSIGQITGHYAPGMGRIEDFYVDPINPNILYLGSRSGGFWKSTDGGLTWIGNTADFLIATGVNSMAVDPINNQNVYISLRNARNGTSHGIYASTDAGDTWTATNFNPINLNQGGLGSNFKINKVMAHPSVPGLFFVGTTDGIFRTTDNFATWTKQFSFGVNHIKFHPTDPQIIYFTTGGSNVIYRSLDQGISYTTSNLIAGNNNRFGNLSTTPACPDCVYFASFNGVWKSTDRGLNFSFVNNPSQGCSDGFVVSDQDSNKILYACVDLEMSTNAGQNFTQTTFWNLSDPAHGSGSNAQNFNTTTNYVHADIRNAKCVNGVFYVSTDGYLARSIDDGSNWELLSETVGIRENYKLGVSQSNHERSICGSQDNGTSLRTENGWVEYFGADGMEGFIHPLNDNYSFGSFQFGGRIRSQDGGNTIDYMLPLGQTGNSQAAWEAPLLYDPNNHLRIYHFSKNVVVSENFGDSWSQIGSPASFNGVIEHAEIAQNNSNIIIVSNGSNLDKSMNGGFTFTSIKGTLPNASITDLAFDPLNDDVIYVVYGSYQNNGQKVFRTSDAGQTWTNITFNLGDMPVHTVVVDHDASSNIYLGTELGVYTKTATANTWSLYNQGLPNVTVEELEIVYGTNTLRAATWGRGLWEADLLGRGDHPDISYTTISNPPTTITPNHTQEQWVSSEIEYSGSLSSVEVRWSRNNQSFTNTIPMTNTGGNSWQSNSAIPIAPANDITFFKVVATASTGAVSETYKFMYNTNSFEYCDATGTASTGADYITNISIDNLSTGANVFSNSSGKDLYALYYDSAPKTLEVGDHYRISIQLDFAFVQDLGYGWIDFNADRNFSNDERILITGFVNNMGQSDFTVPPNAVQNQPLRLRVRNIYSSPGSSCGSLRGEVEDYVINLVDQTLSQVDNPITEFVIYPNPSENIFTVEVDPSFQVSHYSIYDLQGRLIQSQSVQGRDQFKIDLSSAASQVYFISIKTEKGYVVKQIVKK